jgi:HlyD family secretion protein
MSIKSILLRWGLPLLALLLFVAAIRFISTGKPEQTAVAAIQTPAIAPSGKGGVVAGAGVVQPSSELVAIGVPVSGLVKTVEVRVGAEVRRGQVLFTIDDREAQADIGAKEAAVALAKQNLNSAEIDVADKATNLKSYEAIDDKRAMIAEELTRRRFATQSSASKLAVSRATMNQFQAQLVQARTAGNLRTVRAPIDGTILQLKVRVGEFVPAMQLAEPLITMGAIKPLHVKIDIDEADITRANLSSIATISLRGAPQKTVETKFVRIEPLVVPKRSLTNSANERVDTRVLQVVYELPANAEGYFVGQQVDAFVPSIERLRKTKAKSAVEEMIALNMQETK